MRFVKQIFFAPNKQTREEQEIRAMIIERMMKYFVTRQNAFFFFPGKMKETTQKEEQRVYLIYL